MLSMGSYPGGSGTYDLSSGDLNADYESIGGGGPQTFTQTGGIHTVNAWLYLGSSGGSASYELRGAGVLTVMDLHVGDSGSGSLTQSGSQSRLNAGYVDVGLGGRYDFSAGSLKITGGGLRLEGPLDFHDGSAMISVTDGILDLTGGVLNSENAALAIKGSTSLLILPIGFDPEAAFFIFSNEGMTHVAGTPLTIDAGRTVTGAGTLSDPVAIYGTIRARASGEGITLINGIIVAAEGNADLGGGTLWVNDQGSGMTGGQLSGDCAFVGYGGVGRFTQTGGTHTVNAGLYLGLASGSSGTYDLSSGELISTFDEYIGGGGSGTFNQTGGTHTVNRALYLDSAGTYDLSSGVLNAPSSVYVLGTGEYIGYTRTGTFTQTGGTHTVGSLIELGSTTSGVGTYELGGGALSVPTIYVGGRGTISLLTGQVVVGGQGIFRWTGGTLNVQDIEIGGTNSRFSVGQTAQFAGALHANGGAVEVDFDDTLTLLGEFGTTQEGKTITKEGAGALRIEGAQVYAAGAILSVAEGTVFMDTAAGDATTHNLEIDVGGGESDALIVFEADEYLSMLHILSGGTAKLGDGCHVLVLDTLWIDGFGQFQNITLTNTPEPTTLALVGLGVLALLGRRGRQPKIKRTLP